MYKIGDLYKKNRADNTLMLSNFTGDAGADFWEEYRTNHTRYDAVFNRMFNSFKYFMQLEDDTLDEVVDQFRDDVYNHLLINKKKYEELYRVQVIPDDDYSLINNYDMQEIMDKDVTDNQDNEYGQRIDSGSFTKGARIDSGTQSKGQQTDQTTESVAPYDSVSFSPEKFIEMLSGSRLDATSFTEGSQSDSSSNTKGQQKDDLDRTYTEDYTLHRVGNIGVQTVSDMLGKHIKLWSMWEFYEYIFKEICKDLLLI